MSSILNRWFIIIGILVVLNNKKFKMILFF